MCHNLHSFFQVLVKVLPPLQQLNYFPERLRGLPSLSPSSSAPTYCCETSSDSTHHRKHTQPLGCWKLTHCQFFHQIIILQIIFKTLELYNVCSLGYKELQKIDTLLNTKKRNDCSWSGFLHIIWSLGHMRRNRKIEGSVQGAWSVKWLRTAQSLVRISLQSNRRHQQRSRGVTARN